MRDVIRLIIAALGYTNVFRSGLSFGAGDAGAGWAYMVGFALVYAVAIGIAAGER